jgi:hypothetical protein
MAAITGRVSVGIAGYLLAIIIIIIIWRIFIKPSLLSFQGL